MSNRSMSRSSLVMIWLGVAGCGGLSRPATDGSFAIQTTGETDMPSDKHDSKFNPLSAEESRVILGKGTERAFVGEYTDLKDPAPTSAGVAMHRSIVPMTNSRATAVGPASTMRSKTLSSKCPTATVFAPKSSAITAVVISATSSWEKNSRARTPATA